MKQKCYPRLMERNGALIYGVNPVLEALKAGVVIKVFVSANRDDAPGIASLAGKRGVPVERVSPSFFDALPKGHQSVAAKVREKTFAGIEDMLEAAKKNGEPPLLVALDGVEDPRNMGAIMRSALALGAHGIIIGKHRQAGLTPEAYKASAGAAWSLPVSQESNIKYALDQLKEEGLFIAGTSSAEGIAPWDADLTAPLVLVLGGEGAGLRRVVAERCDYLLSIPMRGVGSLNVSVSAGIFLSEILRQRSSNQL